MKRKDEKSLLFLADFKSEAFCKKLIIQAHKKLGGLDVLALVAGKQYYVEKIADRAGVQFEETYQTNVFVLFWLCEAALPLMPSGGSIITTASIQATHPSPALLDYAPTKAAILAFTRALARQVASDGIRVNRVAPRGPIEMVQSFWLWTTKNSSSIQ